MTIDDMLEIGALGGSRVDAVKAAEITARFGAEHVRICERCGLAFFSVQLKTWTCWPCWYDGEMEQAAVMFKPLSEHLERILEVKTSVDQTGGMTMCLRVPIGRIREGEVDTRKWAWFSEYPGDALGVGLYEVDEEGEYVYHRDENGELQSETFHEYPEPFECHGGGANGCGWYHHPKLCEDVAKWAAPLIVEFATKEETP